MVGKRSDHYLAISYEATTSSITLSSSFNNLNYSVGSHTHGVTVYKFLILRTVFPSARDRHVSQNGFISPFTIILCFTTPT
jgi:hypothetical protein